MSARRGPPGIPGTAKALPQGPGAVSYTHLIDFQCGWGPVRVEGTDAVSGLAVKACLSVKDASGAFRPSFAAAQTRTIPADAVIFAIGQAADLDPFAEDVAITPRRTSETAVVTFETSRPDVFAAGDAASGPASAIQAIAGEMCIRDSGKASTGPF